MSTDRSICTNLIRTLEDGKNGFESSAEKIADSYPDVAAKFRQFAAERAEMADELQRIADSYGDDIEERGTVAGALHRGWIAVKDVLTGDDADAVIAAAERGEDHAVEQFDEALEADISLEFRPVVAMMASRVRSAHDYVSGLAKAS